KPQQAFYIVDQEGNNMDPLTYPDYLKYLEQAKALFKKPQRSNQSPIYPQYTSPNSDSEEDEGEYNEKDNQWYAPSFYLEKKWISPTISKTSQNKSVISCKSLVTESKQNEKVTMPNLFSESDDQLLELLSPAMRKKIIDSSTKNKWAESLEYI
ncbi:1257_t:CDS:2, partial [Racocetra persica]